MAREVGRAGADDVAHRADPCRHHAAILQHTDPHREVEEAGGEGLILPIDVADAEQVESAASAVEDAFGPIDVWVNDAMVTIYAQFLDIEPREFRRARRQAASARGHTSEWCQPLRSVKRHPPAPDDGLCSRPEQA